MKTKNWKQLLHVFNFLHKLSFENSFCFLSIFDCQTNFLISKIEKCFWKQKVKRKNNCQTYPNVLTVFSISHKSEKWYKNFPKNGLIIIVLSTLVHITHILFGICLLSWMLSRTATKIFPIYYWVIHVDWPWSSNLVDFYCSNRPSLPLLLTYFHLNGPPKLLHVPKTFPYMHFFFHRLPLLSQLHSIPWPKISGLCPSYSHTSGDGPNVS